MTKFMPRCFAIATFMSLAFGTHGARAADIFDTTGSSGISTFSISPAYVSTLFHTTASDFVIESLSIQTNNTLGTRSGNIVVKVYSAGVNQPGSQVGPDLGTFAASGLSTSISLTGLSRTLAPSTNYWLVLDLNGVTGGVVTFRYSTTPSGPASPFYYAQSTNSGATWSATPGIALIGVITAVPEPGTVLTGIVSAGAIAICGFRRHEKNRGTPGNRTA